MTDFSLKKRWFESIRNTRKDSSHKSHFFNANLEYDIGTRLEHSVDRYLKVCILNPIYQTSLYCLYPLHLYDVCIRVVFCSLFDSEASVKNGPKYILNSEF